VSERVSTLLAVSAGGLLGANARFLVGQWAVERWGIGFPVGTLLVNVIGSFVLGFYLTLTTERFIGRRATRLFVATGFLGAFTTFSTFSYEIVALIRDGSAMTALVYVVASLVLGLVGTVAGILCAHAL
jgi:CrcB protein